MDDHCKITNNEKKNLFTSIKRHPKTLSSLQFAKDIAKYNKVFYRDVSSARRNKFSNLVSKQRKKS